jgi:EpsI family protein
MLGTVALTFALTPKALLVDTAPRIDMEAAIPKGFGDWQIDPGVSPVSASPEQQETLDQIYDQTVSRTYVNSKGHRIMLSVAHGAAQNRQLRVHRQEVCYAAQGFQIKEIQYENMLIAGAEIPVTRMIAVQGQRTEPVTYWFTMGDFLVRSYLDRQVVQLKYAFSGFVPDGYLFRVSSLASDSAAAFTEQLTFSAELLRAMDRPLAEKLIGRAPAQ